MEHDVNMLNKHPHVFSPIKVGPITLKNRILGLPYMDGMATPDGMVTPAMLDHVRMRAKGGVAVVTLGDSSVDHEHGLDHFTPLNMGCPENLAGLTL